MDLKKRKNTFYPSRAIFASIIYTIPLIAQLANGFRLYYAFKWN